MEHLLHFSYMKVILLVGPPCAGKTEWAQQYQKENPDVIVIDRDALRTMLTGKVHGLGQSMEDLICYLIDSAVLLAHGRNKTVIVDQTNCKYEYIRKFIYLYGTDTVRVKEFFQPYPTLMKRNNMRAFETKTPPIPAKVMKRLINWYVQLSIMPEFKKLMRHA